MIYSNDFLLLKRIILLWLCASSQWLNGQPCICDHVITQPGIYRPASQGSGPFYLNVQPGDVICIQAGTYSDMRFFDFQGAASNPIIVRNCAGVVVFSNNSYTGGLIFENCRYFHVSGSGVPGIQYGLKINGSGSGASGLVITRLSSDFEVDHVEVAAAGFAGMMIKTDPNCDPATWQQNFTMFNVDVHDNYITNTGGEGLYIGNAFWNKGIVLTCNGQNITVYPHNIIGLKIHHNIIENVSADGIQYGCSPDALVYQNVIIDAGSAPFGPGQDSGIQCGGGAGGSCYNNVIKSPGGTGIIVLGHLGGNKFYNNLIVDTGGYGFFCNDDVGSQQNSYFEILNNTFVNAGSDGIRLYNQNNQIVIRNNAIVKTASGQYVTFGQGASAISSNNFTSSSISSAGFLDLIDYKPSSSSPLVNAGMNIPASGVTFDLENTSRPFDAIFDIGAYEFQGTLPVDLLTFTVKQSSPSTRRLTWDVVNESNLAGYEVQRSGDGSKFQALTFIKARNQNEPQLYDFTDFDHLTGHYYYRLKIIESDYRFRFSKIVSGVINDNRTYRISCFQRKLIFSAGKEIGKSTAEIFTLAGSKVATYEPSFLQSGTDNLSLENLPPQVYIVTWTGKNFRILKKFVSIGY